MTKETPLYGGAITAKLSEKAIDVSEFRDVPDTQEVFLLEQTNKLDQAIIIDLLESVEEPTLPEIISVHLSDILDEPASYLAPLESFYNDNVQANVHTFLLKTASSKQDTDSVKLFMYVALLQVSKAQSDVVLTMTVPCEWGELDQEKFFDLAQKVVGGNSLDDGESVMSQAYSQIKTVASTFKIIDWGLFN
ncbi:hypothetical protein JCM33374_g6437 [Metschnikowia sp. JCM 33374]|nr:hypothetical protein JCM33374_g6437 [Metschnikowia sp. JCM 33374]